MPKQAGHRKKPPDRPLGQNPEAVGAVETANAPFASAA